MGHFAPARLGNRAYRGTAEVSISKLYYKWLKDHLCCSHPTMDSLKVSDVHKTACYGSRSRHLWTDEVCTSAFALSAFKIPV